jgi:hypothetical protein|tara:strand:+ start:9401 stop:9808 length:408 start_codon:yes stop_codon:yes gene_type:complete
MVILNYATPQCAFSTYYWNQDREVFVIEEDKSAATHMVLTDQRLDCVELDVIFHDAFKTIRHQQGQHAAKTYLTTVEEVRQAINSNQHVYWRSHHSTVDAENVTTHLGLGEFMATDLDTVIMMYGIQSDFYTLTE